METRKRAAARALKSTAAAQLGRSGAVDSRKAELELPYGRSIFLAVAAADGSTMTGAVLSVLCTALALLALRRWRAIFDVPTLEDSSHVHS